MRPARIVALAIWGPFATGAAAAADSEAVKQLAPTGTLRIGVAYAPAPTPVFAVKDAAGAFRGVPRDLGVALANSLGVPFAITAVATTGDLTQACAAGTIDIGFMPVDEERR